MAAKIKVKSQDQQDLDELNALNSSVQDQQDLDELNALNDVSPMAGLKNLAKNSGPILNALDLERRYASPAAALAAARPDLLEESEHGTGFGAGESQFPSMAELLNRRAAKMGETVAERAINQPMRQVGGFLADMMTPSMALTMGGSSLLKNAPRAAKAARIYEGLANPLGEIFNAGKPLLEGGGEMLYRQPFKRIDATADVQKGVQKISDLAREYGITGDYREILNQLRTRLNEEGQNIGKTVGQLQEKISPSEIMNMSENAASMKLGSLQDRENILKFIDNELDLMTPTSFKEDMAKYVANKNKYNADILKYNDMNQAQGRLFEQPQTELFSEMVPFTTKSEQSKVIGGNFENYPQSTMGSVEVRNPDIQVWERDPRNPNLQRQKGALENAGTVKIAGRDYSGPTLMGEGAPKEYLPIGEGNNYSPKPQVVNQVEQATTQVPLTTPSARDVESQLGFMDVVPPMAAPVPPTMPEQNFLSFLDLFDLKKTMGKKGFRGIPDKTTGAMTTVPKKQMAEIYGAYDNAIKNQAAKELGPDAANKLAESIDKYSQVMKNKGGFKKLSTLAEGESAFKPDFGVTSVRDMLGFIPPSLVTKAQTGGGMMMMKAANNPWLINTGKVGAKSLTPLMINDSYE